MDPRLQGIFPRLTQAELANPRTLVVINDVTMELWQLGHIYGVHHEVPKSEGTSNGTRNRIRRLFLSGSPRKSPKPPYTGPVTPPQLKGSQEGSTSDGRSMRSKHHITTGRESSESVTTLPAVSPMRSLYAEVEEAIGKLPYGDLGSDAGDSTPRSSITPVRLHHLPDLSSSGPEHSGLSPTTPGARPIRGAVSAPDLEDLSWIPKRPLPAPPVLGQQPRLSDALKATPVWSGHYIPFGSPTSAAPSTPSRFIDLSRPASAESPSTTPAGSTSTSHSTQGGNKPSSQPIQERFSATTTLIDNEDLGEEYRSVVQLLLPDEPTVDNLLSLPTTTQQDDLGPSSDTSAIDQNSAQSSSPTGLVTELTTTLPLQPIVAGTEGPLSTATVTERVTIGLIQYTVANTEGDLPSGPEPDLTSTGSVQSAAGNTKGLPPSRPGRGRTVTRALQRVVLGQYERNHNPTLPKDSPPLSLPGPPSTGRRRFTVTVPVVANTKGSPSTGPGTALTALGVARPPRAVIPGTGDIRENIITDFWGKDKGKKKAEGLPSTPRRGSTPTDPDHPHHHHHQSRESSGDDTAGRGGSPTPLPQARPTAAASQAGQRAPTKAPSYSLFPKVGPAKVQRDYTPLGPGPAGLQGRTPPVRPTTPEQQQEQPPPELKSAWDHTPSPPLKHAMKEVARGWRKVSEKASEGLTTLRTKKSKMDLKEALDTRPKTADPERIPQGGWSVPPMPQLAPWIGTTGPSNEKPLPATPVAGKPEAEVSTSAPRTAPTTAAATVPVRPPRPLGTSPFIVTLRPPPEGRFKTLGQRSPSTPGGHHRSAIPPSPTTPIPPPSGRSRPAGHLGSLAIPPSPTTPIPPPSGHLRPGRQLGSSPIPPSPTTPIPPPSGRFRHAAIYAGQLTISTTSPQLVPFAPLPRDDNDTTPPIPPRSPFRRAPLPSRTLIPPLPIEPRSGGLPIGLTPSPLLDRPLTRLPAAHAYHHPPLPIMPMPSTPERPRTAGQPPTRPYRPDSPPPMRPPRPNTPLQPTTPRSARLDSPLPPVPKLSHHMRSPAISIPRPPMPPMPAVPAPPPSPPVSAGPSSSAGAGQAGPSLQKNKAKSFTNLFSRARQDKKGKGKEKEREE